MKPRVFIGSSSESLEVANAIQQNLSRDAETTVWNQGVFKLSSTVIDDLMRKISESDFAIFVCNPDDTSTIRNKIFPTVRDNVIFELGLFIGILGRDKVFYLQPENQQLHLPTDLIGITPGLYESNRRDRNMQAAVGPFTNEVRLLLKEFKYKNLSELSTESEKVRELAITKPFGFEYLILAEMLNTRLSKTRKLHESLKAGSYFVRAQHVNPDEYLNFMKDSLEDFLRFTEILSNLIIRDLEKAMGPSGTPSVMSDLKDYADSVFNLSIELFNWEIRNEQLSPDSELLEVKDLLRGGSETFSSELNKLPSELQRVIAAHSTRKDGEEITKISIVLELPKGIARAAEVFKRYYEG